MRQNGRTNQKKLLALLCVPALLALPGAASASTQPPELRTLEQKMAELKLTSERFEADVSFTGRGLPRALEKLRGVDVSVKGEASTVPAQGAASATVAGKTVQVRVVGGTAYLNEPSIAAHDGGRPWVSETSASSKKLFSNSGVSGGASTPFANLAGLLADGSDVHALGGSTIDGQAVAGFSGRLNPSKLASGQLSAAERKLVGSHHLKLTGHFQEFIAADGLPVRSLLTLGIGRGKLRVSVDVPAVNFPLTVAAPAATETITASELAKLIVKAKHGG